MLTLDVDVNHMSVIPHLRSKFDRLVVQDFIKIVMLNRVVKQPLRTSQTRPRTVLSM